MHIFLLDFAYTLYSLKIFSGGDTPGPRSNAPVLGPRHKFPLGSPVFPLFPFYETTTLLKKLHGATKAQYSFFSAATQRALAIQSRSGHTDARCPKKDQVAVTTQRICR